MAIRSAVIGCGSVGPSKHIPILERHGDAELIAVCDTDEQRLRDATADLDVRTFTDAQQMVEKADLDSVHICTPPGTHLPLAETLLDAEVSLLIEKPVTASVEEANTLVELGESTDQVVSVVHNWLFRPYVQRALRKVERGDIGDIVSVSMLFCSALHRDLDETGAGRGDWVFNLPGGELGEGLAHQTYLPLAFVDGLGAIESVATQNFRGFETVDLDGLSVQAVDGTGDRLVNISVATQSSSHGYLYVFGTDGELCVDLRKKEVLTSWKSPVGFGPKTSLEDKLWLTGQLGASVVRNGLGFVLDQVSERAGRPSPSDDHAQLIDAYLDAVKNGGDPPVTLAEARDVVRVLERAGGEL